MTIDEVRAKVQRMLIEILGSAQVDKDGDFRIQKGSCRGWVKVKDYGDGDFLVAISAFLLFDVPESPELFEWIAKEGSLYYFGHPAFCSWETEGKTESILALEHTLFANTLDLDELRYAVFGVFGTADDLDDSLKDRFGGELTNY